MAVDVIARALGAGKKGDARQEIRELQIADLLHLEEINDTVQTITYDANGVVQKIEHAQGTEIIRTDVFTFTDTVITEVRTLNSGESLTIVTNLDTLVTTVTYTE